MFKNTPYAAIALLLTTGSASADWQYTKWGMTVEEVTKASGNQASKPKKPSVIKEGHIIHLLSAPYKTNRFGFKAEFWFGRDSKELEMVKLDLSKLDQCPALIGELKSVYGKDDFKKLSFGDLYKWRDTTNNNNILLMDASGLFCDLTYENIVKPGERGL